MGRRHAAPARRTGCGPSCISFRGAPGVGRRTLALRFAQALNCTQPPHRAIPCGTCRDCKQIEAMQHPDLTIIQAESEGGILKVDHVREARRPDFQTVPIQISRGALPAVSGSQRQRSQCPAENPGRSAVLCGADPDRRPGRELLPTIPSRARSCDCGRCRWKRWRPFSSSEYAGCSGI